MLLRQLRYRKPSKALSMLPLRSGCSDKPKVSAYMNALNIPAADMVPIFV